MAPLISFASGSLSRAVRPALSFALLLVAFTRIPLVGQPLQLAGDARTVPSGPSYFPVRPLAEVNGALLMIADDGIHGIELWRTDGTAEGTWMVRDICPGSCSSGPLYTAPENRTGDGGLLFFSASDGVHGGEPWVSDGTFEGTRLVADINPGIAGSRPEWFRWSGDEMLFAADDGVHGLELWSAGEDGSGAVLVADIRPGPAGSAPIFAVGGNGTMWFAADDGVHGREPWISDGTAGGTAMLVDLVSGSASSILSDQSYFPGNPTHVAWDGSRWWFQSTTTSFGTELWVTDGTPGGTERVEDALGNPARPYYEIVVAGGVVFFRNIGAFADGYELWRTDGTGVGTYRVKDLDPSGADWISGLTAFGSRVFFRASRSDSGSEPWISDGTDAGTVMLADIAPGPDSSVYQGWARRDAVIGDRVFFYAGDSSTGDEPWITDGTPAGTHAIVDARPGPDPSASYLFWPPSFGGTGGHVVFFALGPTPYDHEPWATTLDGEGASLLADLNQQASSPPRIFSHLIPDMVGVGDAAYWQAVGDDESRLPWRTRGQVAQAAPLPPAPSPEGASVWQLVPLPGRGLLLFVRAEDNGNVVELFRSDGTEGGTAVLAELGSSQNILATDRQGVYLDGGAVQATDGDSTWTVDPLVEAWQVAELDEALFIVGSDSTSYGLWRADAPFEDAALLAIHAKPTSPWDLPEPTVAGDRLFYAGSDAASGVELWVSDGMTSSQVLDIAPGPQSSLRAPVLPVVGHYVSRQRGIVPHGEGVLFVADDGIHGLELWRSGGTPDHTEMVADLRGGALGSEPLWLTPVGDHVYFVADDGVRGRELWRTDGTALGTELLDLAPGTDSSAPAWLIDIDGVLYLVFTSPAHGVELWRLAPGASVPELVEDLLPGPGSSSPSNPTLAGRRLFVIANDGVSGYEPWSFVVPSRLPRVSLASQLGPGGVELVLRVEDAHEIEVPDAEGNELELTVTHPLKVLGVTANLGTVDLVGNTINWSGSVPGGEPLVIVVPIGFPPASGKESRSFHLQGELRLDTDGDGVHDTSVPTDDPALPGHADSTVVEPPNSALIFGDGFERGDLSAWRRSPS
jgi:ELWxxDGT repeat protein